MVIGEKCKKRTRLCWSMVISSLFFPSKRFILECENKTTWDWRTFEVIAEKINIQIRGLFKMEIFFQKMRLCVGQFFFEHSKIVRADWTKIFVPTKVKLTTNFFLKTVNLDNCHSTLAIKRTGKPSCPILWIYLFSGVLLY